MGKLCLGAGYPSGVAEPDAFGFPVRPEEEDKARIPGLDAPQLPHLERVR
ncbi:MAG: hypothetical protein J7496_09780 [Novosphingobium sp.]|nr:hypothetical protein [Novosphingobium sp.]